ncbi:MAG TPA: M1 family aminopeptidase [Gemmatimonadaceae bacterium]|nr:M1 family aminopeptidase [Gemmatimonadaceae bacterium]
MFHLLLAFALAQDTSALIAWGPPPPGAAHAERVRTYAIRHQIVNVQFDWRRHAVVGSTTLTVTGLSGAPATREVALDAVDMTISTVTSAAGKPLSHTYDGHTLTVRVPASLTTASATTFTVAYETVRPKKGAYFIDRRHVVWTQGCTEDTRYWVPTYDNPNGKETWEFYIRTAKGEKALSNGRLVGSRDVDGQTEWHWSEDRPASTYLMTAVTGDFVVLQDRWRTVPVDYWVYPDSVQAGWRGFSHTPNAIDLYSTKIGIDYPWEKYDQVVAPDFIFGGMENVTATTQTDDGILHPAWAEPQQNADGLMAHELGHQWFGDYVTTRTWAHAWLNEGFATFMEQIHRDVTLGADEGALDRLRAQRQAIQLDQRGRRPLVYDRYVTDPLELFDGQIYPKGATVLQMMRHQLGDSLFWVGMHRYAVDHAYGTVESADLERAFEQASGRDLTGFFKQWVYGAGLPAFRVSYTVDSARQNGSTAVTVVARQVQPRDSLTGYFDANVDVAVWTDAGVVRGVMPVHGDSSSVTLTVSGTVRAIRWDSGRWLLQVYDFPRPTAMLVYQLAHDDVTGRLEAIELLQQRAADPVAAAALATAATHDPFWYARTQAVTALPATAGDVVLAASRDADSRVRQAGAKALRATARLHDMAEGDSSLFVRGAALMALAGIDTGAAIPLIHEALGWDSWTDLTRTQALHALGLTHAPSGYTTAETYLGPSTKRSTRVEAIALLASTGAGREGEASGLLVPLLNDDDMFVRASVADALGRLGATSSIAPLQARRAIEAQGRVVESIDRAVAKLGR